MMDTVAATRVAKERRPKNTVAVPPEGSLGVMYTPAIPEPTAISPTQKDPKPPHSVVRCKNTK